MESHIRLGLHQPRRNSQLLTEPVNGKREDIHVTNPRLNNAFIVTSNAIIQWLSLENASLYNQALLWQSGLRKNNTLHIASIPAKNNDLMSI